MWVIYSPSESSLSGEQLYWNNTDGWTVKAGATVFPDTNFNLPLGGEWRPLENPF